MTAAWPSRARACRNMAIALAVLMSVAACADHGVVDDPSTFDQVTAVELSPSKSADPRVTNGSAYDAGELTLDAGSVLIVQNSAHVEHTSGSNVIVYLERWVDFYGHPPRPITPLTARRSMGCAWLREGKLVWLATYGEWSNMEGAARTEVVVVVPSDVTVERFGGPYGVRTAYETRWSVWPYDPDYWYAYPHPAEGWSVVETQPDPTRHARRRPKDPG
jgi:hypothetical protein